MKWEIVTTEAQLQQAKAIRHRVFVMEQGVSEELEHDEYDKLSEQCTHILLYEGNEAVGTGRIRKVNEEVGKLERICVLHEVRGKGAGAVIMQALESIASKQGLHETKLGAQLQAKGFYEKLGYETCSDLFMDAGIEHVLMRKKL